MCPVCKHTTTFPEDDPAPAVCPACGLVFHKYRAAQEKKAETEAIRSRLGRISMSREEAEEQRLREEEEERRKQLLEEEIRKEMGLRGGAKKPWKQWAAIAATLVVGLSFGVFGTRYIPGLHQGVTSDASSAPPDSQDALAIASDDMMNLSVVGAAGTLESEQQLIALSSAIAERAAISNANTPPSEAPSGPERSAPGPSSDNVAWEEENATSADLEWNWLIEQSIQANLTRGVLNTAQRLTNHLTDTVDQAIARTRIAANHAKAGRDQDANALIVSIIRDLSGDPSAARRVEHWAAIAPILAESRRSTTASRVVAKAIETAARIEDAGDQAEAWAVIALAQAQMGLRKEAQDSLVAASRSLERPMSTIERARSSARLSSAFDALGSKDAAQKLLNSIELSTRQVPAGGLRDAAMEQIAAAWADIGDWGLHLTGVNSKGDLPSCWR
ncbi:hypothetical protein CKO23_24780 [Thiocystis violacea]|nr:hypothetical protein [Thiocystis violacea]